MKKLFILLMSSMMAITASAQKEVTVKAGTQIPLQIVNQTAAADVKKGQQVAFRVARDVNVDGVTAIPYGTIVKGVVYQAKKSSWWGTKGRLGISITEFVTSNGEVVPLANGNVYVTGNNRTPLSVITSLFVLPCCFITGSKAEIPPGYEVQTNVASNVQVKVY